MNQETVRVGRDYQAIPVVGWLSVFAIAVLIPFLTLKYAGKESSRK